MALMDKPVVHVERLFPEARLPRMAHPGEDLAFDLFLPDRDLESIATFRTYPHGIRVRLHSGLRLYLPPGIGALVESRSGLAWDGVDAVAGRIDPGYRGVLWILLHSLRDEVETRDLLAARIREGKAVAQLRFVQVLPVILQEGVPEQDWARLRGEGGLGSTDRR